MKKWVLKAVVQKIISFLPFSHKVNYLFQKYVTKGVRLSDDYFIQRLEMAKQHIEAYGTKVPGPFAKRTLELGTGWYPVVPLCFYLAGAEEIYSTDITPLTKKKHIVTTLEKFREFSENGKLRKYIPVSDERMRALQKVLSEQASSDEKEIAKCLRLNLIVQDARSLDFGDGYFDLVHSNNTFEHIYPQLLIPILKEFKRVTKKVQSHFIDMSDHFAHFDKSINIYHYLKYSDSQWARIDNNVQPQNRMRKPEYEAIYKKLLIPYEIMHERPGSLEELRTIKLDKRFGELAEKEVAVSHCSFVSYTS